MVSMSIQTWWHEGFVSNKNRNIGRFNKHATFVVQWYQKKSTLRQLDFESNILALCEKALLILCSVLPLARGVNPLNQVRNVCNENYNEESAINTLSNCLFICKYVVDIDLDTRAWTWNWAPRYCRAARRESAENIKTRLQTYKQRLRIFISTNILDKDARQALLESNILSNGLIGEVQSFLTMLESEECSKISASTWQSKGCIVSWAWTFTVWSIN